MTLSLSYGEYVLHLFLAANRSVLIDRCNGLVLRRSGLNANDLEHGIPIFLDQLIKTLAIEQRSDASIVENGRGDAAIQIGLEVEEMARLHGRDLLERGFTLEQVVRDYGEVCQAVTGLAFETKAPIEVDEFRTFNRCLDNAIAGAVTEYSRHAQEVGATKAENLASRLGPLAHELRNYLHTATLVVGAIKKGNIGISGATGAVLDRSLLGMRHLLDRALAEVRITARMPSRREAIRLTDFLSQVKAAASFDALARGTPFTLGFVSQEIFIHADAEMLAAALGNLLQNAFKFTKHHTHVALRGYVAADRVMIDVEDQCGGLPNGAVENMFLPFTQNSPDQSGLGLGLEISKRGVEANDGILSVRDMPGIGCVFTIDLPLHRPS